MNYEESIEEMRADPTLFVEGILGADPDPWQTEVMAAVASGSRGISIRRAFLAGSLFGGLVRITTRKS